MWCLVTNTGFTNSKETRHNFVWDTSPSQVPGREMERWGLTVDAWEDSAHRARLSCPSMKALSTHPRTKTFCGRSCCQPRVGWFERRKWRVGHCNKTRRLVM